MFSYMLTGCGLTVPRPEIKEGEFAFSVTYEFNGETKTISGVYVCEYAGISWALDGGYSRDWKGYIKGDEEEEMMVIGTTAQGGKVEIDLDFYPEYFMGDSDTAGWEAPIPYVSVTLVDDEGMMILHEPDEVEENCGAKIASYEYSEPIENSFAIYH